MRYGLLFALSLALGCTPGTPSSQSMTAAGELTTVTLIATRSAPFLGPALHAGGTEDPVERALAKDTIATRAGIRTDGRRHALQGDKWASYDADGKPLREGDPLPPDEQRSLCWVVERDAGGGLSVVGEVLAIRSSSGPVIVALMRPPGRPLGSATSASTSYRWEQLPVAASAVDRETIDAVLDLFSSRLMLPAAAGR